MFEELLSQCYSEIVDGRTRLNVPDFNKYNLEEILRLSEREIVEVLQRLDFLPTHYLCTQCNSTITRVVFETGRHPYFRCRRKNCRSNKKIQLFKNTIFDATKLSLGKVLEILWQFSCRRTVGDTSETLCVSKTTVTDLYRLFRSSLDLFVQRNSVKLGGSGIVVHVDETVITTPHGGIGRRAPSNTVWVVGGVDINTRSCFLRFLPSRSRADLFDFFIDFIEPGSIIHTDSLSSYRTLSTLGFTHFTVNHSRELVSSDGIHTNWIEGIFGCLKKLRRKYDSNWSNTIDLNGFLGEFCFRYSFDGWNRKKAFLKILLVLKEVKSILDREDLQ